MNMRELIGTGFAAMAGVFTIVAVIFHTQYQKAWEIGLAPGFPTVLNTQIGLAITFAILAVLTLFAKRTKPAPALEPAPEPKLFVNTVVETSKEGEGSLDTDTVLNRILEQAKARTFYDTLTNP